MDAKTVFLFFVLRWLYIQALPFKNEVENSSCIQVTEERAKELHEIGEEVNDFLNELSDKHEDIDFTFVELKVENHADDEDEEKETTLKITVNDCNNKAKNHPKIEDKYFENDDVHGNKKEGIDESTNNKTEDINKDNILESSNNKTEGINNDNIQKSSNNITEDINKDNIDESTNNKTEDINNGNIDESSNNKTEGIDNDNIKKSSNNKTEGVDNDNIQESSNNKTEDINNDNIDESSNTKNGKIDINETSDNKSQNENRKSETNNVDKSESYVEENINRSEEESTDISVNLSKSKLSELDTEPKKLSEKTEIEKNEEERDIVNSKDETKNEKSNKKKHPNKYQDQPYTENDGINNSDRDRDENKHTINENIGNNNIVIYAPSIENTAIEIGSDYQSYANIQNVLRKLTDRRQTGIPISNPTKFYENPIDNFDYYNSQPNYDYDLYTDDAFRSNVVGQQEGGSTNGHANPEIYETQSFEFGRHELDLGARSNTGIWLQ